MQNIHYNPIQLGGGEFRILILQPSSTFSSDIICTLKNVSLESHPPYEALSYVWGDTATSGSTIILEGKPKGVTENLAAALHHLRLENEPRKLWVDALCIDQEDINERDDQVIHMKEIYQHCATDLLWLGDDSSIIEKGAAAMKSMGPVTQLGEDSLETDVEPIWRKTGWKREKGLEQQWFEAISALLGKPKVWNRVWIMQEVSFAPRVVLVSGNATLPWDRVEEFLDAENYIRKYGFPDAFHGPFSHGMEPLRDVLTFYLASAQILAHQRRIAAAMQQPPQQSDNFPPTSSLLDVLARFRHTDATDPRDKVFALLGLTSNPLSITPTYHDSKRQVYTKTATAIINASGNLDLLCQSPWGLFGTAGRDASLPSWVPDFANAGDTSDILFAQRGIYAPAGDEQLQTPCTAADDGRLPLEGWDAGELRKLYPQIQGLRTLKMPDEVLREGIEAGNESLRLLLSSSEEPHRRRSESQDGDDAERRGSGAGLRRFEQYWRTIMLDCKRYPVTRLDEDDVRDLRPKWEAWLRIPYVMKTWTLLSGEVCSAPFPEKDREAEHGIQNHSEYAWGMRFAVLEDGGYAMVLTEAEEGDRVAVLKGAKTPVVVRRKEGIAQGGREEETWTLIGPCYVHGLMDGQIVEKGRDPRTFVLA
ncbi:Heterokaryon incompatibility protein [Lasiodiplodia theobromae]|uniref:Heterokaryon incompatibility protein n=1 Tax=Lasiodiplodia theobromae TaxID=45133 RepID=UPI0015C3BD23|nr:Heterokaryon incompatibility protein [Lasiodiplodia theobromae]KAF4536436.1 Heterokaryon incompatibility protein [Lasiodiplodia theobromae]